MEFENSSLCTARKRESMQARFLPNPRGESFPGRCLLTNLHLPDSRQLHSQVDLFSSADDFVNDFTVNVREPNIPTAKSVG